MPGAPRALPPLDLPAIAAALDRMGSRAEGQAATPFPSDGVCLAELDRQLQQHNAELVAARARLAEMEMEMAATRGRLHPFDQCGK